MLAGAEREFRYPPSIRQVQHFKLAAAGVACLVLLGIALFAFPMDYIHRVSVAGFAIVFFLGAIAVWRDFPKAKTIVRVSDEGIAQIRDGGAQLYVPWSEVVAFRNHWFPRGLSIETAGRTKILRIDADIPQFPELLNIVVASTDAQSPHLGNSAV